MSVSSPLLKASGRWPTGSTRPPARSQLQSLPLYRDSSGSSVGSGAGERLFSGVRRTSLLRLVALLAVGTTCLVAFLPSGRGRIAALEVPWSGSRVDAARDAFRTTDEAIDSPGWSRFVFNPDVSTVYVRPPPTSSQRELSAACADRWAADGALCDEVKGAADRLSAGLLDVVQTWVNGTDPRHRAWRAALSVGADPVEPGQDGALLFAGGRGSKENHVRECVAIWLNAADLDRHDELRHSMRSTFQNLPHASIRRYVLLTSDLPEPGNVSDTRSDTPVYRHGQIRSRQLGQCARATHRRAA